MDARPLRPEALLVELGVIVALWALVVGTIAAFDRVGRRTAALLVPYLLWVASAALDYQFRRPSDRELPPGNNIDLAVV